MPIQHYQLSLESSPSNPSDDTLEAMATIDLDITDLLPYLNSELGPGLFDPTRPYLRIPQERGVIIFYPDRIGISKCQDAEDARNRIEALIGTVNSIEARRDSIEPSYRSLGEIKALDVLRLLPRTNCGECGRRTCLAFATAIARGKARPLDCPPLLEPERRDQRDALVKLVEGEADPKTKPIETTGGS